MDSVLYRQVYPFNPGSNLFNARNGDSREKHSGGPLPRLVLKDSIINWVLHFRLLGVTVDDKLTNLRAHFTNSDIHRGPVKQ